MQFVTLSTQCNPKSIQQLKSGFEITINWNNIQSKVITQAPDEYWDYVINPSFQTVNRHFVLTFDIDANKLGQAKYYLPNRRL